MSRTSDLIPSLRMPRPHSCDFCDEFAGGCRNAFAVRYHGQITDRILCSTENFVVLPSLGQIAEGHLLILPRQHCLSLADIPHGNWGELERLSATVRRVLRSTYGTCVAFERGTRSGGGGCGISHAHLHFVPVNNDELFIDQLRANHRFVPVAQIGVSWMIA